jgi:geranylgeranyl pyrophosphate synthase
MLSHSLTHTFETVTEDSLSERLAATEDLMLRTLYRPDAPDLNALVSYHFSSGGSRVRARLALSASEALGLEPRTCVALAASCELVHNASLLHDDIQDADKMRRGHEAAWFRFDPNLAMCAGTLMLSAASAVLARATVDTVDTVDTASLIDHLYQRTHDLIVGQTLDLAWQHHNFDVAAYQKTAVGKSGSLLALPYELVLIAAGQPRSLPVAKAAGESFALAYQIADDLDDLSADSAKAHCNIVPALMRTGLDQEAAISTALQMARAHRLEAVTQAQKLPSQSGQYMVHLCHTLASNEGKFALE